MFQNPQRIQNFVSEIQEHGPYGKHFNTNTKRTFKEE